MATTQQDIVMLTTPAGHEVLAEVDYEHFTVRRAKVVHGFTGVITPLDDETSENLSRALRAKQVYEHALTETRAIESKLEGFGAAVVALGHTHPAVEPYWREVEQHRSIASDMKDRARHFHENAMKAIDTLAGD